MKRAKSAACPCLAVRLIIALLLSALLPTPCLAAERLPRSVLIIDELGPGGPFNNAVASAIRSTLAAGSPEPIAVYTEYLNLRRFNGPMTEAALRLEFEQRYRETPIGTIIVLGSDALRLALSWRTSLWPDVPVVFTWVNADALAGLEVPPKVTGTTFHATFRDLIEAADAAVPQLERVALVGDITTVTTVVRAPNGSRPAAVAVREGIELIDLTGLPMAEIKTRVAALPPNSAIIYASLFVDGAGVSYAPTQALRQILAVANCPVLVQAETQLGFGALGGFVLLPQPMGEEAGALALRILKGEDASSIPIRPGEFIKPVFDWRELQRWNVSESRLPAESLVRYRRLTAWEQYRWQIVLLTTVIVLQAAMIAGLMYEHRRRQQAEVSARSSMAQLAHMDRLAMAGELSGSIAHEISQPLAGMVAHANAGLRWLAGNAPNLEEARATFTAIAAAGHRAGEVIQHIRALFRKGAPENVLFNVKDLVRETLALADGELRRRRIIVETALADGLPPLHGDRVQLQQVVLNLIINAAEAMETVTERKRILRVMAESLDGSAVVVQVEDSGPGIDPVDLERVFKPFHTTKAKGMGLGLSISRSIVEAHQGRLTASPRVPVGTIFRVVLLASPEA